jgi:hypothetical protein
MSELKIKQFLPEEEVGKSSTLRLQIGLFSEILQAEDLYV